MYRRERSGRGDRGTAFATEEPAPPAFPSPFPCVKIDNCLEKQKIFIVNCVGIVKMSRRVESEGGRGKPGGP